MTVLDASAVLAFLGGEPGRQLVGQELASEDCLISAANWSEVWQKAIQHALPVSALRALAELVEIIPVDRVHAERAATFWSTGSHLSLGDRLCLALAFERDAVAMTADQAWANVTEAQVTVIR